LQLSPLFHEDAQIFELINLSILPLQGAVAFPPRTLKSQYQARLPVFDAGNALIELGPPQAQIADSKGQRDSAPAMGERACSGQLA
jgi:hypothetical protein